MKHFMTLNKIPFNQIKSGQKIIEARLYDEKRQALGLGDVIIFTHTSNTQEKIMAEITGLSRFASFLDMFHYINPTLFGYNPEDTAEIATESMHMFYSKDEEQKWGVLGIHLRLIS